MMNVGRGLDEPAYGPRNFSNLEYCLDSHEPKGVLLRMCSECNAALVALVVRLIQGAPGVPARSPCYRQFSIRGRA